MTTGTADPASGSAVETLTIGSSGPERSWARFRRPALVAGLGLLAVALLALAGFSIYGLVVGGSATARGAAYALVANLNSRDLHGLYQQIDPHERDAYARAVTGLTENARRLGLGRTGMPGGDRGELSLAGIELQLTGVKPTVQRLAPDVALLHYVTGELTASIRPAETSGLVRVGLDAARVIEPVTRTKPVAELATPPYGGAGNGQGVGLIAVRSGLRWYVSPAASAAWISRVSGGEITAGDVELAPTRSPGSVSAPEAAALSLTEGLVATKTGEVGRFAATLVRSEQVAAEILAAQGSAGVTGGVEGEGLRIDAVQFAGGPREGARQLAYLEKLEAVVGDDPLRADSTCVRSSAVRACATDPSYGPTAPSFIRFLASDGKLAVTARESRGAWKISLADTLADGLVNWSAGLTREQAVSVFGLAHLEPSSGTIPVGRSTVTYNSAGYAVRTLTIAKSGRYVFTGPNDHYFHIELRSAAGGAEVDPTYDGEIEPAYSGESYRLTPGDYVVVLWSAGRPDPGGPDHTEPLVVKRLPV